MIEKYTIASEPDKTMFVFAKNGQFYGHIVKNATTKAPAKLVFETEKYTTVDALKAAYPPAETL
ncbi:hypothetical protein [Paenibacillus elgii]|uniref:hypothetical protein n=1 Tax=Paenibacillus elgii TaxID=189691 RepID=UPI000248C303|nr:hypothetical protein [Paenibacillus elgii]